MLFRSQTSFLINEGMPDLIFNRIKKINPKIKTVLILGATFKKDCDDTRNSLSFKMRKVCKKNGVTAYMWDPYVMIDDKMPSSIGYDAVIVMTPHSATTENWPLEQFNDDCIMADLWKVYSKSKLSNSGIYRVGELK